MGPWRKGGFFSQSLWSRKVSTFSLDKGNTQQILIAESCSQDFKELFEFHHQCPVTFLKASGLGNLTRIFQSSTNASRKVAKLEELPVHKSEMWSWQILVTKIKKSNSTQWLQRGGQTGGWESKGRRGQVKFLKMFPDGRIWRYWMTLPNSVELFTVEFFLAEKQTSKVKIPLFWGFLLPSDFPKSGGDPV